MAPWPLIALVAFWLVAIRYWLVRGPKVPLFFVCVWAAGYFGLPALGFGPYFVVAFVAILTAILIVLERYATYTAGGL